HPSSLLPSRFCFPFHHPSTPARYTLSLHDALPISRFAWCLVVFICRSCLGRGGTAWRYSHGFSVYCHHDGGVLFLPDSPANQARSEEHTSELQSRFDLVCRLLLEKKKKLVCQCRR